MRPCIGPFPITLNLHVDSKCEWNLSQFPLDVAGGTSQVLAINVKQASWHSYLRATEPLPVAGTDHCTRLHYFSRSDISDKM